MICKSVKISYNVKALNGWVPERPKGQHWKCCVPFIGTVGSNPTPSASGIRNEIAGSLRAGTGEPRQARKGATVSQKPCAGRGCPAYIYGVRMPLVYVVEDDEDINDLLVYNLKKEGFNVKSFLNSLEALNIIKRENPDVILLDIMLPDMDGLEFCKTVKSDPEMEDIPIIMITAKSTEIDKIVGLELGADDYITKPFSIREVIARIRAILRRSKRKEKPNIFRYKGLTINPENFQITVDGKNVSLTAKEFKLLMFLINSDGKILSRERILSELWKDDLEVYDRTVDVHIKKLRDKLGRYGTCIQTVRGLGYKWNTE